MRLFQISDVQWSRSEFGKVLAIEWHAYCEWIATLFAVIEERSDVLYELLFETHDLHHHLDCDLIGMLFVLLVLEMGKEKLECCSILLFKTIFDNGLAMEVFNYFMAVANESK